jgi:hypothetical protein
VGSTPSSGTIVERFPQEFADPGPAQELFQRSLELPPELLPKLTRDVVVLTQAQLDSLVADQHKTQSGGMLEKKEKG